MREIRQQNVVLQGLIVEANEKIEGLEVEVEQSQLLADQYKREVKELVEGIEYPVYEVETFEDCVRELQVAEVAIDGLQDAMSIKGQRVEALEMIGRDRGVDH